MQGHEQAQAAVFASSQTCGTCHLEIYNSWKNSLHALSLKDPVFDAAYTEAYRASQGKVKTLCLRCHAPTALLTKDYDLMLPITQEGITCDFCHSVSQLNLAEPASPFLMKPGPVKWGPLKRAISTPAHSSQYADYFEKADLCAACHEYKNEQGVTILGTYSEWKEGPYSAEGKPCQDCHMPRTPVKVAGKMGESRGYINLHTIAGGHSVEQLRKTVRLQVEEVKRSQDTLNVKVRVTNLGAGHMVPTGIPSRRVTLRVEVETSQGQVSAQEVIYQKLLVDQQGKPVTRDSMIFTEWVRVAKDNRLAPRESRKEEFSFSVRRGVRAKVKAEIIYNYTPLLLQPMEIRVPMASEEKVAPR